MHLNTTIMINIKENCKKLKTKLRHGIISNKETVKTPPNEL